MKKKYLPLVSELDDTKTFRMIKEIYKNNKEGVFNPLESTGLTISEKTDSISCAFGINENQELFFESERCDKDEKEQALSFLKNNKLLEVVLKNIKKENGPIRFEAEFLPTFNHEFNEEGYTVFGATPYHKDHLGEAGAFVVFDAKIYNKELDRWEEVPDNIRPGIRTHFTEIKEADCKHWRVYTSEDLMVDDPIKLSINAGGLREYVEDDELFEHGIKIINSGWKTPEYKRLKTEINNIRQQLNNDLNTFAETRASYFGEFPEGYVFNVESGSNKFSAKMNTNRYNESKDFNWSVRTSVNKTVKECYKKLKREVLQLGFRNSSTINEIIKKKMGKIEETNNDESYIETIGNILESVVSPDATFDGIKENAKNIINEAENSLARIKIELDDYDYDPNVRRKTIKRIQEASEVINRLKSSFTKTQLEGYEYLVNGFMEVFNKQLDVPNRPVKKESSEINIVREGYKENYPKIYNKISEVIWGKEVG